MDILPDAPTCGEDVRLLEEFAVAAEAYFDAVKTLQKSYGEAGILKAFEFVELTRNDCVAAREAVEGHRKEHGCRVLGIPANA